jgi:uncharacterized protein YndB with AHSA1/START domain
MPDILHLLPIKASPAAIHTALTTTEGVRAWWTRDAVLDGATVGGVGEFGFYGRRTVTRVRVEALTPASHVGWSVIASDLAHWHGTAIAFDLRPSGEATTLAFAHRGFAAADDMYARVTTGWAHYLFSLRDYLERGAGDPNG